MKPRFASLLVSLCVAVTAVSAALAILGPGPALALAILTGLALAGWLWTADAPPVEGLLSPFLAIIPLVLLLDCLRFAGGWVPLLAGHAGAGFRPGLDLTEALWFLAYVCAPASLVAIGGFGLALRHPLGVLMAWWAAFWAIAEALFQPIMGGLGGWSAFDVAGLVPAAALAAVGVVLLQRLLAPKVRARPEAEPASLHRRRLWAILFVALVAVYAVTLYAQAGLLVVGVVVGSMMGGMIGWWNTTSRLPADPARILPLMLLMLGFFYIHVGEETVTGFHQAIAALTGGTWPEHDFLLIIALAGPAIWFFASWSLWQRQAFGNFVLWFLVVGMILGEPAHVLVFPVVFAIQHGGGYAYFSGMYTALFAMIPAILILAELLRTRRQAA
ncbi:hypothetical protein AB7M35_004427 [Amorphus suaedae]